MMQTRILWRCSKRGPEHTLAIGFPADPPVEIGKVGRCGPPTGKPHAIVVGYGRVGKVVCSLLGQHGIEYIAADFNASAVARDRREGHLVYYGYAADPAFLEACGVLEATGIIITLHSQDPIDKVVRAKNSLEINEFSTRCPNGVLTSLDIRPAWTTARSALS
jgi:hypothetical protein